MTAADVISLAREWVADTANSEVWDDTKYAVQINAGQRFIKEGNPESVIQSDAIATISDVGEDYTVPLGLSDEYLNPLAHYVASQFFGTSSGDSLDKERSKFHFDQMMGYLRE